MPQQQNDSITLHYERYPSSKSGSAPIVLFLHGLGSSTLDWSEQVPALTPYYEVLLMDLRGHGKSDKPSGPYSIREMAADVAGLAKALNLLDLHVVGLSMGAQVALQLALDYPAMIATVTAVNSPADMVPRRLRDKWAVQLRKILVALLGMRRLGHIIANKLLPGERFAERRQLFAERWAANDPAAYRASFNAILEWNITSDLPQINQPVLVIAASEDYTPMAWKIRIVELAPNARLVVIEDSRHATPVECPTVFNLTLLKFLDEHTTMLRS